MPFIINDRYFWEVIDTFNIQEKKQFLTFTTGSDRAPIGGLGKLLFTVSRNGPDSDRLPSAHTCFNVLLLNEYSCMEKLKRLLTISIQNYEGFGLI